MNLLLPSAPASVTPVLAAIAFESAAVGIVLLTTDGMILDANRAFCKATGKTREDLAGMPHPVYGDGQHAAALENARREAKRSKPNVDVECSYARPDGTIAWTMETISWVSASPSEPELFVIVVRDVTLEKAAELEATKFKYLSDETSEAHLLINRHGRVVYANNAAAIITGYSRDELLRSQISDWWDPFPAEGFNALFARAAKQHVKEIECRIRRKGGSSRVVKLSLFGSEFNSEHLLSALIGESNDHQRVREALRESEARLRIAVDLAKLSVYGWDPVSGALSWDARLKAMWGLPADAFVNYDVFWSGIHPEDKPLVDRAVKRTLDPADGFYQAEFRVIGLQDGVERWVAACGQTFFKDGKPVGYIGAALDITERKRIEKDLEQVVTDRTAELRDVVTELEAFSYSISHDMRAPLRAIQGFAQILEEECNEQVNARGKEYIRRIVTAADRMDQLIQDALTYSRVTRSEMPMENVDLASLVNGLLEGYPQFQSPAAEIRVHFPLPRVRGNVAALTQCFSNLIGNAVQFVAPGVVPQVEISARITGTRVQVSIRDNGIGIDPAAHEKIFQLFYRLNPKREGTGIGLAVAQRAAQRMNGTISLTSIPGVGSTFILDLEAATWK